MISIRKNGDLPVDKLDAEGAKISEDIAPTYLHCKLGLRNDTITESEKILARAEKSEAEERDGVRAVRKNHKLAICFRMGNRPPRPTGWCR